MVCAFVCFGFKFSFVFDVFCYLDFVVYLNKVHIGGLVGFLILLV